MLLIILAYLLIGVIWALLWLREIAHPMNSWSENLNCGMFNMFFWPLSVIYWLVIRGYRWW